MNGHVVFYPTRVNANTNNLRRDTARTAVQFLLTQRWPRKQTQSLASGPAQARWFSVTQTKMNEATQEALSKSLENLTDLLHKLAGPLAEEVGLTLGDKAREYRTKNAIKIFQRVKRMLAEAGIDPSQIAPRLFLPMVQAASLEDDESIQEKWAALFANVSASLESVAPSYIEVLKELTPDEVRFLDRLYKHVSEVRTGLFPQTRMWVRRFTGGEGIDVGSVRTLGLRYVDNDPAQLETVFRDERFLVIIDDLVRLGILRRVDTRAALKEAIDKARSARSEHALNDALRGLDHKLDQGVTG